MIRKKSVHCTRSEPDRVIGRLGEEGRAQRKETGQGRVQHAKEEERGKGEGRGTERKERMLSNLTRSLSFFRRGSRVGLKQCQASLLLV